MLCQNVEHSLNLWDTGYKILCNQTQSGTSGHPEKECLQSKCHRRNALLYVHEELLTTISGQKIKFKNTKMPKSKTIE